MSRLRWTIDDPIAAQQLAWYLRVRDTAAMILYQGPWRPAPRALGPKLMACTGPKVGK